MRFLDRADAGRRLAELLRPLHAEHPLVLALPRGGIPVAAGIAAELKAPVDVLVVRKIGMPGQPELAMGAVGADGVAVWNDDVRRRVSLSVEQLRGLVAREVAEARRRAALLRGETQAADVSGRAVILVDDGAATGSTAVAACRIVRAYGVRRLVVALPVASPPAVRRLAAEADDVVCVQSPASFAAVGEWYADFDQVSDAQASRLLSLLRRDAAPTTWREQRRRPG